MYMRNFSLFDDIILSVLSSDYPTYYQYSVPTEEEVVKSTVETTLPFNMKVTDKGFAVELAMAGVKDGVEVTREGKVIKITIKANEVKEEDSVTYLHKGIKLPSKKDNVSLVYITDKFDISKADVTLNDGLLTLFVPLADEEKPKSIEVKMRK